VVTTKQTTQTEEKRRSLRETKPSAVAVAAGDGKRGTPVFNTGAHEHLATALEMLTQRSRQIEEELARVETLQVEQDMIRKQIDAINAAMQVFRP
jgi:predicted RNA-binding protein with PIN domain